MTEPPRDHDGDLRPGPLADLVVLDFSRVLSGPICGRALADMGADVIKVEPPAGDLTRFAYPKVNSLALYFTQQNVGKRNLSLDLNRPEAVAVLKALVARSDVVVENFRPGVMARLGLGWDDLSVLNPRLVYASLTGYGQDGPWRDRRAYAVAVHAETGTTAAALAARARLGTPGDSVNEPFSHADVYAGLLTLSAILAALHHRERTGRGQHVDVSMAQSMLFVNEHVQAELSDVDAPGRVLSLAPGESPLCELADGTMVTIVGHPCSTGTFERYCRAMARPDLPTDARFATEADRLDHASELYSIVRDWAGSHHDVATLEATLAAVGLAMGEVRTVADLAASDWARARDAIAEVDDRGRHGGVPNAPFRFSNASARRGAGPPTGASTTGRCWPRPASTTRRSIASKPMGCCPVASRAADALDGTAQADEGGDRRAARGRRGVGL
ncbi:MAG: CoA transferase [Acidimicrobiales bacterium]